MSDNQAAVDKAAKIGEEFYKNIVLEAPVNKLPEKVFESTFLPYFTGKKSLDENPDILKIWISIAGNPGAAVDVMDNNTDDVLFRVPPLYNTDFIHSPANFSIPYSGIINEFEQKTATSPTMGEKFLKNILDNTQKMVVTSDNHVEEYKEMWNKVFEFYNIKETKENKTETGIDDGELIFD